MRAARLWLTTVTLLGCAGTPESAERREQPPAASVDLEPRIDVHADDEDLALVMERLGAQVGRNILVDPGVQERVTLDLRDVAWREAVDVIARLCRCDVEERAGGVVVLTQRQSVTVQCDGLSAASVTRLVADQQGVRVVFDGPEPPGGVNGTFQGARAREVIAAVLATVGDFDVLEEDGGETLRVVPRDRR